MNCLQVCTVNTELFHIPDIIGLSIAVCFFIAVQIQNKIKSDTKKEAHVDFLFTSSRISWFYLVKNYSSINKLWRYTTIQSGEQPKG